MASLADVIRKQRTSGSGATGALVTSIGKKTLEKIDPRRMFNQQGIITALFPSLKAYKADGSTGKADVSRVSSLSMSASPLLQEMIIKLDNLSSISKVVAKNSQALPGMSRDMNIMRQNISKLVKLQGGQSANRADAFFLRANEREKLLESSLQQKKERPSQITKTGGEKKSSSGLGLLGLAASGLMSIVSTLVSTFGSLAKTVGSVISTLSRFLPSLSTITSGISFLSNIVSGFADVIKRFINFIVKSPLGKALGLTTAAAAAVGAPAAILYETITSDKTRYNESVENPSSPEEMITPPSENASNLAAVKDNKSSTPSRTSATKSTSQRPTPVPTKSVTSGPDGDLLDFIAQKESGGDYNAVFGQGSVPELTQMTIAEVLDYQRRLIAQGQQSAAAGRYQFIRSTLAEEAQRAGLDINTVKFTPEVQDKLILNRLKRLRGLDKFRQGKITPEQFAENLSMEFASLPSPIKGGGTKSYYEGIAGNTAGTSLDNVYAAIQGTARAPSGAVVASASESREVGKMDLASAAPMIIDNSVTNNSQGGNNSGLNIPSASPFDNDVFLGLIKAVGL